MKLKLLSLFFALFLLPFVVMGQCGSNLFVNDADGNSYATLKVGPHCWMQSNLKTRVPGSSIYRADMYPDTTANLEIYGRLYNWYAAMNVQPGEMPVVNDHGFVKGVCPEGWHLPNDVEVAQLMTNTTPALHDVHYWLLPGTNTTNYTMRPGGYYDAIMNRSENLRGDSYMWTAQNLDESSPSIVWSDCHCDYFLIDKTAANNGMSVRCVHRIYQAQVATVGVSNVKSNQADLTGEVIFAGYDENYTRGFIYGTDMEHPSGDTVQTGQSEEGNYSFTINDLAENTTYHFRAYVVNDFDTVYGEVKNFTTLTDVVTDTIAFLPNGGQGAMDTMFVTRGDTVLNANAYTHSGNWQFTGWNTAADGSGTQYADQASITTSGNLTLYAQWHTWCTGIPKTSVNEFGTSRIDSVKDVNNNQYAVVQIGNQCWMKENLRTSTNPANTGNIYTPTTAGYNVATYGRLYDWAAVMQGESSTEYPAAGQVKVQGICPAGWHVPSDAEWDTLTYYVYNSANPDYKCSGCPSSGWEKATECIAKALAATTGWKTASTPGTCGDTLSRNNATGFSALPAGAIYFSNEQPKHNAFSQVASFSSATDVDANSFYTRALQNNFSKVGFYSNTQKKLGLSVRCLRDAEAPAAVFVTTDSATTVTKNGAKLYGTVASLGDNEQVTAGFRYGQHPDYMTFKAENTASATGSYNAELTGISPNTTYYFQAYAATATDTAWATDTLAFTTLTNPCQGTAKGNEHASSNGIDSVRDSKGNSYLTVQIGSQCWMAQNLRTETVLGSYNPSTEEERYDVENYGLLYTWDTAAIICPQGWHLPSNTEWNTLSATAGVGMSDEGTGSGKLAGGCTWNDNYDGAPTGAGNYLYPLRDSTGFSALPTGAYHTEFHSFGDATQFWCANSGASAGNAECYIMYHGIEYNYIEEEQTENLISVRCVRDEEQPPFTCGTSKVKDIDNNEYNTVPIGNQCWMKENLRTTKYANGTAIEVGTSTSTTISYRYAPNRNESNVATYGYLYNWVAVMNGANSSDANPSGVQGICPTGWHVPSDAEWTQLTNYVSSQSQYVCDNDNNIAKALASTTGWNSSTETCAVGNIPDNNNKTGFSALPAGGVYGNFGGGAYVWSATEGSSTGAYYRNLYYKYAYVNRTNNGNKGVAFSVRCLRDAEVPAAMSVTTDSANTITKDGATLYGNVTDMGGKSEVNVGFKYGTSEDALTSIVAKEDAMTATGQFSCDITGLTANTQYYYKAFAANGTDTVYGEVKNFTTAADVFTCGTSKVKDIDNNEYNTVPIGNQCWMKENLRTTKYANGTAIEVGTSTSTTISYRYAPNGNESNVATYGYLYNWVAVMNGASSSDANPSRVQGICPVGWHVPSNAEWTQLTDYVSSQSQYVCGDNKIAKALASTTGWNSSTSPCAVGNIPDDNNKTGFSAFPAGNYGSSGYNNFGNYARFWSATENKDDFAYGFILNAANVIRSNYTKGGGISVRCLRDAEVPAAMSVTTDSANTVTSNSATLYGNVIDMGGNPEVNAGFKYGTSEDALTTIVAKEDAMTATGLFSFGITGLTANTQYYYKAFAANGTDTVYGEVKDFTTAAAAFTCGTSKVKDIDNNEYNTVQIGTQCWMKENLRTTKKPDGTSISSGIWTPGSNSVTTYGRLYSWTTVMNGATSSNATPSGVQGICPDGWHVPSNAEWTQLTDYVSNQSQYVCGNNTIAKALASKTGWNRWNGSSSTATCAVGDSPDDNNKTGFSALPAGNNTGSYGNFGDFAYFWSATEDGGSYAYYCGLYFDYAGVHRSNDDKYNGFSVRCLRDK